MSELTEDRTQKQFYAQFGGGESPGMGVGRQRKVYTPKRLPSYIGVQGEGANIDNGGGRILETTPTRRSTPRENGGRYHHHDDENGDTPNQKLDTIMSTAVSLPPQRSSGGGRRTMSSSPSDNRSVHSTSKLSVAQRARLQADEQSSNSIRVRAPPQRRGSSDGSLLGNIGKSLTEVIDQSVLGIPSSSEESDDISSEGEGEERQYGGDITHSPHSDTGVSEAVS